MRANKFLATCGLGSRRAVEQYVQDGRVKINGVIVTDLATQISQNDTVELDDTVVLLNEEKVYIALNKPRGCVTTCKDDKGRRTVLDVLGGVDASEGKHLHPSGTAQRVFPVGRLDYDTEGLLLLTNDGDFAHYAMHPSSNIQKKYIATVDQEVTQAHIKKLQQEADKAVSLGSKIVEITIHEGKNRQVRKMLEGVGLSVMHLKRVSIGHLTLEKLKLKSGEWKVLKERPVLSSRGAGNMCPRESKLK